MAGRPAFAFAALCVAWSLSSSGCRGDFDESGDASSSADDDASAAGGEGMEESGEDGMEGSGDDGGADCAQACDHLSDCGVPTSDCLALCGGGGSACAGCLVGSSMCGEDCLPACEGGDETGSTGSTTDTDDTTDDPPNPNCTTEQDCGLSSECIACGLTDSEGWCEFADPCNFDSDCGIGRVCGYNVETSEYRCLSADYCP